MWGCPPAWTTCSSCDIFSWTTFTQGQSPSPSPHIRLHVWMYEPSLLCLSHQATSSWEQLSHAPSTLTSSSPCVHTLLLPPRLWHPLQSHPWPWPTQTSFSSSQAVTPHAILFYHMLFLFNALHSLLDSDTLHWATLLPECPPPSSWLFFYFNTLF